MNDVLAAAPDLAGTGRDVLVGVLLLFVGFGAIPVAVLVPAWTEAAG